METVFTLDQIKERWTDYKDATAWRVLKGGMWEIQYTAPDLTGGATRAEMIKVKDHVSFPEYLEKQ